MIIVIISTIIVVKEKPKTTIKVKKKTKLNEPSSVFVSY